MSVVGRGLGLCCALWTFCISVEPGLAQDLLKSSGSDMASVRLIAASAMTKGRYRAGVVIAMPSGSHTYWKQPGDAGVPPVFAFNGSTNVAKAEVEFPTPARITEDGLDAFGYTDRVAFPVLVTPADPGKPSSLHVDLSYAVCNKICMPGHSTADLALPTKGESRQDEAVAVAFALVPTPLTPSEGADLTLTRVAGAKTPTWTLRWTGKTPVSDVFADAPEGYAFDTKAANAPGTWTLVASQLAPVATSKIVPVTLTLAGQPQSFVTTQALDTAGTP